MPKDKREMTDAMFAALLAGKKGASGPTEDYWMRKLEQMIVDGAFYTKRSFYNKFVKPDSEYTREWAGNRLDKLWERELICRVQEPGKKNGTYYYTAVKRYVDNQHKGIPLTE